MPPPSESVRQFLEALAVAGVDRKALDNSLRHSGSSAAALGVALLEQGAATPEQIESAQRGWAQQEAPQRLAIKRLGNYTVERTLGKGAAGEVYLVRDSRTGANFAAKCLVELSNAEERLRFQREAHTLAQLKHPHIAQIHAAELEGSAPYFVLDYYSGGTLRAKLERGPLEPEDTQTLLIKLASGLAAAHALGVLHRDLKPENVLFDESGEPRLTDFGLGLLLTSHANRLTQTGTILGTPSYMPPEQVRDPRQVDARSDVYGLGAVLYHCLTGQPPFPNRGSLFATLNAVLRDPVPPPATRGPLSAHLAAVCMRALEKDPSRRYPTAQALADALSADPAPPRLERFALLLALGLAAAAVIALVLTLLTRPGAPIPPAPDPPPPVVPVPADSSQAEFSAGVSPERALRALQDDDLELAWRQLCALDEAGQLTAEPALRLVQRIESPEWFAAQPDSDPQTAKTWSNLVQLRLALAELTARCREFQIGVDQYTPALFRAIALAEELTHHDRALRVSDALLLETFDAYLGACRQLPDLKNLNPPPPPSLPTLDRQRFPHAREAQDLFPVLLVALSQGDPGEVKQAEGALSAWLANHGEECLSWPVDLAGEILRYAGHQPRPKLLRAWIDLALRPGFRPPRPVQFTRTCRILAERSLNSFAEDPALRLELARDLVSGLELAQRETLALARSASEQGAGVPAALDSEASKRLGNSEAQTAAKTALYLGDLDAAERYLLPYEREQRSKILLGCLHIERARRLPAAERGPDLEQAERYLSQIPTSRHIRAARHHLRLLAEGSGWSPADALPPADPAEEGEFTTPTPVWYLRYGPGWRFPCEAPDGRRELWLPPTD